MADDVTKLGFDAQDYYKDAERIARETDKITASMEKLAMSFLNVEDDSGEMSVTLTKMNDAGVRVSQTFSNVEGVMKSLRANVAINIDKFAEMTDKIREQDRVINDYTTKLIRLRNAKGQFTGITVQEKTPIPTPGVQVGPQIGFGKAENAGKTVGEFKEYLHTQEQILQLTLTLEAAQKRIANGVQEEYERRKAVKAAQQDLYNALERQHLEERQQRIQGAAEIKDLIGRGEEVKAQVAEENRRNTVLEAQEQLYRRLAADAQRLDDLEKQRLQILSGQAQITKEMEAAKAKALLDSNSKAFGQSLFDSTTKNFPIDPNQAMKISSMISQITAEIKTGSVEMQRAEQIIQSVMKGESAFYEGAEAKIANATRRIVQENETLNARLSTTPVVGQLNSAAKAFKDTENQARKSSAGILLSWESMGRLFMVQMLHTGLRTFMDALRESIDTTVQFEKRISEIRTIAQGNQQSFDQWSRSIQRLSAEFGNPVLDTAESVYQALSSQLVEGADATNLVAKAMQFSRVTMSDTSTAVNLLTSALNSYHLQASSADEITETLFKTVTLGKLRAQDLAAAMPRTMALSYELGINLKEVGAAIDTFTQSGMPASEAVVLLNNGLSHLIKPTTEMKSVFKELGVASGEDAIAMYGLGGVLAHLSQHTHDSATEIGKLERDLRAIRFEIGVSGAGLDRYNENFRKMSENTGEYAKAIAISLESPAVEIEKFGERVKAYIRDDFSAPILDSVVKISHGMSDEGLLGVFKGIVTWGTRIGGLFVLYKTFSAAGEIIATKKMMWATAERQALIINTNSERNRAIALQESALMYEKLAAAQSLTTEGNFIEARAADLAAMAHFRNAEAAGAAAAAQTKATAASVAFGNAWKSLSAVGPQLILTAIVAGSIYLWQRHEEQVRELAESTEKAADAAAEQERKITDAVEHEVAKQNEIWAEGLRKRFAVFNSFADSVSQKLEAILEAQKDATREAVEATKEAINDYVRTYEEGTRKIQEVATQLDNNIRKAQEERMHRDEQFAEKQFQLQMQIAQHQDRMATPGKDTKVVDQNQLNLIQAELNRVQAENKNLLKPTGDMKTDAANQEQFAKNIRHEEQLQNDLLTRRLHIEEESKENKAKIEEIERKIKEHQSEADTHILREANRDAETTARRGARTPKQQLNSGPFDPFKDERHRINDVNTAEHDAGEVDRDKKALDEAKARQKILDDSLKVLPTINSFQEKSVDLQKKLNDATEEYIKLQEKLKAEQEKQVVDRQKAFADLHVLLTEIEKFKYNQPEIKTKDDLRKVEKEYESMTDRAVAIMQKSGMYDLRTVQDFVREEVAIHQQGILQIAKLQQQADLETISEKRKQMQQQRDEAAKDLDAQNKKILDLSAKIKTIIGSNEKDKGSLRTVIDRFPDSKGASDKVASSLSRLLEFEQKMQQAVAAGQTVDPATLNAFKAEERAIEKMFKDYDRRNVDPAQEGTIFGNERIMNMRLRQETDPKTGKSVDITLDQELLFLRKFLNELGTAVGDRNTKVQDTQTKEQQFQKEMDELAKRIPEFKKLSEETLNVQTNFANLAKELSGVVERMSKLKDALDHMQPTPAPGHASGGIITEFKPMGTDRVPAMLTPGEFVMNAEATRRFLPELKWMNSRYMSSGGMTYNPNFAARMPTMPTGSMKQVNITFGDIHAHVHSSGNAQTDARQLVKHIERELRLTGKGLAGETDD